MDLALFDFDGTITDRETFGPFVEAAVPRRRLAIGKCVLALLVIGYRLGLVPGTVVRAAVVRVGFSGLRVAALESTAEAFANDVLPTLLRPEALRRIDWHRQRGDRIIVVSGAFDLYLQPWCRRQGLELLCSVLDVRDGHLTGHYRGRQCVGAEKVHRVRQACDLASFRRSHAYGDTREDLELLSLAHDRYYRWVLQPA